VLLDVAATLRLLAVPFTGFDLMMLGLASSFAFVKQSHE